MNDLTNPYAPPSSEVLSAGACMPGNGEIMSRAWRIYRQHFVLIAVTISVIWIPGDLLSSYMDTFVFAEDDFRGPYKFAQFLENFFGIIASAGVIHVAMHEGSGGGLGGALSTGMRCWPSMWWARFVSTLMCVVSLLLLVVPFFYLYPRLMLIESALVTEGLTGMEAIKRSQELVRGRYWQAARLMMLMILIIIVPISLSLALSIWEVLPEHWLLDAASSVIIDVLTGYETVCCFCLYQALSNHTAVQPDS